MLEEGCFGDERLVADRTSLGGLDLRPRDRPTEALGRCTERDTLKMHFEWKVGLPTFFTWPKFLNVLALTCNDSLNIFG